MTPLSVMDSEETLMGLDRETMTLPFKSVVNPGDDTPIVEGGDEEDGVGTGS